MSPLDVLLLFLLFLSLSALAGVAFYNLVLKKNKMFSTEFEQLAQSTGFDKAESDTLKNLMRESKIPKPYLIFSDASVLEKFVNLNLQRLDKEKLTDEEKNKQILYLFELKRRITNHYYYMWGGLKSTREIDPNQLLSLNVTGIGNCYSIVILNDHKKLLCSIPEIKDASTMEWKDRDVSVYLWRSNDAGYQFKTRIEAAVLKGKLKGLILAHTDELKRALKREHPRRRARFGAKFFQFKITSDAKGKPIVQLGKTHVGIVTDVSTGGASIATEDPLAKGSSLKLEFLIDDEPIVVYGKILDAHKKKNFFILRAQFQRINDKAKGMIYRYVYNYID